MNLTEKLCLLLLAVNGSIRICLYIILSVYDNLTYVIIPFFIFSDVITYATTTILFLMTYKHVASIYPKNILKEIALHQQRTKEVFPAKINSKFMNVAKADDETCEYDVVGRVSKPDEIRLLTTVPDFCNNRGYAMKNNTEEQYEVVYGKTTVPDFGNNRGYYMKNNIPNTEEQYEVVYAKTFLGSKQ